MFETSLNSYELQQYVVQQLNNFYPDNRLLHKEKRFESTINRALERTEYCFQHVSLPTYHRDKRTYFSHLHADQYTVFLWFLSNEIWRGFEDEEISSKIFGLNKILNGFHCMYNAELPDIFLVLHGNGIVLGRATYGNYLVCFQGTTVGAVDGHYPTLGSGVTMAPNSSIIGKCNVGNLVTVGNHALLRNRDVTDQSLYYRDIDSGKHSIKFSETPWAQSYYNVPIL
jgi:serine O-acetyltransferase